MVRGTQNKRNGWFCSYKSTSKKQQDPIEIRFDRIHIILVYFLQCVRQNKKISFFKYLEQ